MADTECKNGITEFSNERWLYEESILVGLERPDISLPAVECYETEIRGAKLSNATLSRWVFEDCTFVQCDMSNIKLNEVSLQKCQFRDCRLIGIDWRLANPFNLSVSFDQCQLAYSNFSGLSVNNLIVQSSDCSHVDFTEATLSGSIFTRCNLAHALFDKTDLRNADFSSARQVHFDPRANTLNDTQVSMEDALAIVRLFGIIPS